MEGISRQRVLLRGCAGTLARRGPVHLAGGRTGQAGYPESVNLDALIAADRKLTRIIEIAWAEAARLAGDRLMCHAGCGQCCHGPFPVNMLDAWRLQRGIRELAQRNPELAKRIAERARRTVHEFRADFPGDIETGILGKDRQARHAFFDRLEEVPCPALSPESGACEIHEWRPVACRVAGPPIRCGGEAIPHCRLCFVGAAEAEVEAARVEVDPESYELSLLVELGLEQTLIAFPLSGGK